MTCVLKVEWLAVKALTSIANSSSSHLKWSKDDILRHMNIEIPLGKVKVNQI